MWHDHFDYGHQININNCMTSTFLKIFISIADFKVEYLLAFESNCSKTK